MKLSTKRLMALKRTLKYKIKWQKMMYWRVQTEETVPHMTSKHTKVNAFAPIKVQKTRWIQKGIDKDWWSARKRLKNWTQYNSYNFHQNSNLQEPMGTISHTLSPKELTLLIKSEIWREKIVLENKKGVSFYYFFCFAPVH